MSKKLNIFYGGHTSPLEWTAQRHSHISATPIVTDRYVGTLVGTIFTAKANTEFNMETIAGLFVVRFESLPEDVQQNVLEYVLNGTGWVNITTVPHSPVSPTLVSLMEIATRISYLPPSTVYLPNYHESMDVSALDFYIHRVLGRWLHGDIPDRIKL